MRNEKKKMDLNQNEDSESEEAGNSTTKGRPPNLALVLSLCTVQYPRCTQPLITAMGRSLMAFLLIPAS